MWVETEATTPKHDWGGWVKENLGQNTVKRQTVETEAKSKHSKKTDSRERGQKVKADTKGLKRMLEIKSTDYKLNEMAVTRKTWRMN